MFTFKLEKLGIRENEGRTACGLWNRDINHRQWELKGRVAIGISRVKSTPTPHRQNVCLLKDVGLF